jgi:transcriptional regulator with XRE-family HTH domain
VVCREFRTAAGLTQKDVAEAGDLEQSRVSEVERGRYVPGLDLATRLAKGLGVSLTELVAGWEGLHAEIVSGGVRLKGVRVR